MDNYDKVYAREAGEVLDSILNAVELKKDKVYIRYLT